MKIKFKTLVAFSAFLVAGCAAFFSVFGLSQLFAGASLAVIIMASSLEFAKIISVSFLQRYWKKISNTLKTYLSIGIVVLVCITSAGIYGFLSNAYQKTATQYEIGENELSALSSKKALFQKNIDDNKAVLDTKTKRLDQLSSLRTSQEARLNQAASNAERNRVRQDINTASTEIQKLNGEIDMLNSGVKPFIDSVSYYENKIIESKTKNSSASEVGPLKYIATLVGQPMDKVVNWFILLLIFVFDPLAMALVIATNKLAGLETEEPVEEDKDELESRKAREREILNNYLKPRWEKPTVDPETGELNYTPVSLEQDYWIGNKPDVIPTIEELRPDLAQPTVDPETGKIDLPYDETLIEEDFYISNQGESSVDEESEVELEPEIVIQDEPVLVTGGTEEMIVTAGTETIITEPITPELVEQVKEETKEKIEELTPKVEPVVPTGQIKYDDIKEIKAQKRGFSKDIPNPSTNTIQRIGNKYNTKNW